MTTNVIPFIRKDREVSQVVQNQEIQTKSVNNQTPTVNLKAIESVLMKGDLTPLTVEQRIEFYKALCQSLHLNWMTKPFDYIVLNGKLTLYAKKDCTEQLRRTFKVSIRKLEKEIIDGICIFTACAEMPDGRTDQSSGVVSIAGLKGELLANAVMKAETKSKRRVTLSICGLGFVDESEIDSIQGAKRVSEDYRPPSAQPTPSNDQVNSKQRLDDVPAEPKQEPIPTQANPKQPRSEPKQILGGDDIQEVPPQPEQDQFCCGRKMKISTYLYWYKGAQQYPLYCTNKECKTKIFKEPTEIEPRKKWAPPQADPFDEGDWK